MSEKCPKCGAALKHNQREDWKCGTFIDPGQAPSLVVSAQCRVNVLEAKVAALEAQLGECHEALVIKDRHALERIDELAIVTAERDRLLTAGCIALVPVAMLMGERAE